MNIIPIKVEYICEIMNHTMSVTAIHSEKNREISFYFDEKVVSKKIVEPDSFLSDDDCIRKLVEDYCQDKTGVYADIFKHHSNKVILNSKKMELIVENLGIEIHVSIVAKKDKYQFTMSTNHGEDHFSGEFCAVSFSEALEKMRIFISMLDGISYELAGHINELSNDKIEEWIRWKE